MLIIQSVLEAFDKSVHFSYSLAIVGYIGAVRMVIGRVKLQRTKQIHVVFQPLPRGLHQILERDETTGTVSVAKERAKFGVGLHELVDGAYDGVVVVGVVDVGLQATREMVKNVRNATVDLPVLYAQIEFANDLSNVR